MKSECENKITLKIIKQLNHKEYTQREVIGFKKFKSYENLRVQTQIQFRFNCYRTD